MAQWTSENGVWMTAADLTTYTTTANVTPEQIALAFQQVENQGTQGDDVSLTNSGIPT